MQSVKYFRSLATILSVSCVLSIASIPSFAKEPTGARLLDPDKVEIIDGDTFRYAGERIRIVGYDAPEIFDYDCIPEKAWGHAALGFLKGMLVENNKTYNVTFVRVGKDRYGRTLARVFWRGQDLAEVFIEQGFGYTVEDLQRRDWCDRLLDMIQENEERQRQKHSKSKR